MDLLEDRHLGEVVVPTGEFTQAADLFIPPTLVLKPNLESKLMEDELFGPILPIVTMDSVDQMLEYCHLKPSPLALYIFTDNEEEKNHILANTKSGGVCINDTLQHMQNEALPFGGHDASGFGNYHGLWGFKAFTHERAVLEFAADEFTRGRYPPYK